MVISERASRSPDGIDRLGAKKDGPFKEGEHTTPKQIIFDVGGVIFDYKNADKQVSYLLNVSEQQLADSKSKYVYKGELGGITHEKVWENVLKELRRYHQYDNVLTTWWSAEHWILDTKVLIQELHEAGYPIAIFTNNWAGMGETTLEKLELSSIVIKRFESSIEGLRKPNIVFYKLIEKRTQAHGQEIYFIDDTERNIKIAKKRQWQTFHYDLGSDRGKTSNDLIRKELLLRS